MAHPLLFANLNHLYFKWNSPESFALSKSYSLPGFFTQCLLRILATLEAKTSKISNFWTFWPVIQLIQLLLTCGCTPFCPTKSHHTNPHLMCLTEGVVWAVLASSVASILNACNCSYINLCRLSHCFLSD